MTHHKKGKRAKINKGKEMRTKEISNMINEGGLGADKYYDIKKKSSSLEKENSKNDKEDQ